jgi:hypothetical protein
MFEKIPQLVVRIEMWKQKPTLNNHFVVNL